MLGYLVRSPATRLLVLAAAAEVVGARETATLGSGHKIGKYEEMAYFGNIEMILSVFLTQCHIKSM